jgi:hypothetical protein
VLDVGAAQRYVSLKQGHDSRPGPAAVADMERPGRLFLLISNTGRATFGFRSDVRPPLPGRKNTSQPFDSTREHAA